MRKVYILAALIAALSLFASCGGGQSAVNTPAPTQAQAAIDPSGNWMMTATDSDNVTANFSMIFSQSGSVVSNPLAIDMVGGSPSTPGEPSTFQCYSQAGDPGALKLSNAVVQNVNQFSGTLEIVDYSTDQSFGSFQFTATLSADGASFTGNYTNMPSCAGLAASGTYAGFEVPSVSGTWNGTMTPCTMTTGGTCVASASAEAMTMSVTQDDSNGTTPGSYSVTGDSELSGAGPGQMFGSGGQSTSSGCPSIGNPFGPLSGTAWVIPWQEIDNNTIYNVQMSGTLTSDGHYSAILSVWQETTSGCNAPTYRLVSLTQQ